MEQLNRHSGSLVASRALISLLAASLAGCGRLPEGTMMLAYTCEPPKLIARLSGTRSADVCLATVQRIAGTTAVGVARWQLTNSQPPLVSDFAAWSPDGRYLAYLRHSLVDRRSALWLAAADGSDAEALVEGMVFTSRVEWSPAVPVILFVAFDRDGREQVFSVTTRGVVTQLTSGRDQSNKSAAWSPDGSRIAFFSDRGHDPAALYTMAADGTGQTRLTDDVIPSVDLKGMEIPAWSPDGEQIAVAGKRGDVSGIFVVDGRGGNASPLLLRNVQDATSPAWSPDGNYVAYAATAGEGGMKVFVTTNDGRVETLITKESGNFIGPRWAPDSDYLTFVWQSPNSMDVYVARRNGCCLKQITISGSGYNAEWAPHQEGVAAGR